MNIDTFLPYILPVLSIVSTWAIAVITKAVKKAKLEEAKLDAEQARLAAVQTQLELNNEKRKIAIQIMDAVEQRALTLEIKRGTKPSTKWKIDHAIEEKNVVLPGVSDTEFMLLVDSYMAIRAEDWDDMKKKALSNLQEKKDASDAIREARAKD